MTYNQNEKPENEEGWWDKAWAWAEATGNSIEEALLGGWEWANDQIDTYIWDTGEEQAVIESLIKGEVDTTEAGVRIAGAEDWYATAGQVQTYETEIINGQTVLKTTTYDSLEDYANRAASETDKITHIVDEETGKVTKIAEQEQAGNAGLIAGLFSSLFGEMGSLFDMFAAWASTALADLLAIPANTFFALFKSFFFEEVEE